MLRDRGWRDEFHIAPLDIEADAIKSPLDLKMEPKAHSRPQHRRQHHDAGAGIVAA
jgi:hypothetical protein